MGACGNGGHCITLLHLYFMLYLAAVFVGLRCLLVTIESLRKCSRPAPTLTQPPPHNPHPPEPRQPLSPAPYPLPPSRTRKERERREKTHAFYKRITIFKSLKLSHGHAIWRGLQMFLSPGLIAPRGCD